MLDVDVVVYVVRTVEVNVDCFVWFGYVELIFFG